MARDYYEILGVQRGATKEQIRDAYRKLALEFHPDRNKSGGAEERFKEISEAYAVLSDDQKREQYDAFGSDYFRKQYSPEDIFRTADFSGFEELFKGMGFFGEWPFSSFESQGHADFGRDLQAEVQVSLEEVLHGAEKTVKVSHAVECPRCKGLRAEPGTSTEKCQKCRGSGRLQRSRNAMGIFFSTVTTCPDCGGDGEIVLAPCRECRARGTVEKEQHLKVSVPAGVHDGMHVRLRGEGGRGRQGSGDLYVLVSVSKHPKFERDGDNVWTELPVSFGQAVLGARVDVPTLDGKAHLDIPSGTDGGTVFRLRGEGLPNLRSGRRGDELARIKIVVPKRITKEQEKLLREIEGMQRKGKRFGLF